MKCNLLDRHSELMSLFEKKKCYAWYFDSIHNTKKRFTPFKSKPNFEDVMHLETD
jgi:hypothetical protein